MDTRANLLLAFVLLVHGTMAVNIKSVDGNQEISISGVLPPYDWDTHYTGSPKVNRWNASITIESDIKPSMVYCNIADSHSVDGDIEYLEENLLHTYTLTVMPTSEVLDLMLAEIGTRCTVIIDIDNKATPFHFYLRTGGIYVPDKGAMAPIELLGDEFRRASYLIWIAIGTLSVTMLLIVLVPCAMACNNRRNRL